MPQLGTSSSRFRLESHDHSGQFVAALPYRNLQGEWMLNAQGQQLRGEVPFRNYAQVTTANVYAGKHELWLYDTYVSSTDPIFAGPIWDITAGSDSGTLNFSAQCPLSYLAKRALKAFKDYAGHSGPYMMNDLISYVNSVRATNMTSTIQVTSAQTSSQFYLASDRNIIADLLDSISQLNDGTDYYFRTVNGQHVLNLYGGHIKPTAKTFTLEYGASLDGYSAQYVASILANDVDVIASNGLIGNATNATKQTEYNALYTDIEQSDQTVTADLNQSATTIIKDKQSTKVIPSIVTRKLVPIKDFDFGSQFQVIINDNYVNVNQTIRVTGWQLTIGQGDSIITVLYTKDTEGVS